MVKSKGTLTSFVCAISRILPADTDLHHCAIVDQAMLMSGSSGIVPEIEFQVNSLMRVLRPWAASWMRAKTTKAGGETGRGKSITTIFKAVRPLHFVGVLGVASAP